jgi:hypothetical protein
MPNYVCFDSSRILSAEFVELRKLLLLLDPLPIRLDGHKLDYDLKTLSTSFFFSVFRIISYLSILSV